MKTIKVYRCKKCGEDVFEGQGECVGCGAIEDPARLVEVEIADVVSEEVDRDA